MQANFRTEKPTQGLLPWFRWEMKMARLREVWWRWSDSELILKIELRNSLLHRVWSEKRERDQEDLVLFYRSLSWALLWNCSGLGERENRIQVLLQAEWLQIGFFSVISLSFFTLTYLQGLNYVIAITVINSTFTSQLSQQCYERSAAIIIVWQENWNMKRSQNLLKVTELQLEIGSVWC